MFPASFTAFNWAANSPTVPIPPSRDCPGKPGIATLRAGTRNAPLPCDADRVILPPRPLARASTLCPTSVLCLPDRPILSTPAPPTIWRLLRTESVKSEWIRSIDSAAKTEQQRKSIFSGAVEGAFRILGPAFGQLSRRDRSYVDVVLRGSLQANHLCRVALGGDHPVRGKFSANPLRNRHIPGLSHVASGSRWPWGRECCALRKEP